MRDISVLPCYTGSMECATACRAESGQHLEKQLLVWWPSLGGDGEKDVWVLLKTQSCFLGFLGLGLFYGKKIRVMKFILKKSLLSWSG